MSNGYQYEIGNKFPLQWRDVHEVQTDGPLNMELPLLKSKSRIVSPSNKLADAVTPKR